jgi:uncharacterized protein (DUF2132 family)
MINDQKNNPLHGKTLEVIMIHLVNHYGWDNLGRLIRINCFNDNPDISSSLKFLRKTDWPVKRWRSFISKQSIIDIFVA